MNPVLFVLPSFGVLLILVGILQQNEKFIRWQTNWRNSAMGTRTKITNATINAGRVGGIISIISGLILFLLWYFVIVPNYFALLNQ